MKPGPKPNYETARKVLEFLVHYKKAFDGASPSLREIAKNCGIKSHTHAEKELEKLVEIGAIVIKNSPRRILILGGKQ